MKPTAVISILNILLTLQARSEWQVRHGGLLGIKYLLAVRKDMTDQLLPVVLSPLITGLEDCDDDVRAVSATAMLPVVDQMLSMSSDQVITVRRKHSTQPLIFSLTYQ
jgi:TATA-binding protein-associated factor